MKTILSLLLVLSSFSAMAALSGGNEEKTRTVVQVVDAITGEPIIGADIHVDGEDMVYYTDPDGFVELEHFVETAVQFKVSYISYEDMSNTLDVSSAEVVIALEGRH